MPFNLPSNFCTNPDAFLRKPRPSEPTESPPAPNPPRYNWPIEGEDIDTPEKTIRTIIPSSSHTLTSENQPDSTLTPDARIVRDFFNRAHLATPLLPGSFIYTPMPQVPAESSRRVGEIQATEAMSQDDIINTLQSKVDQLEHEKSEWKAKAQLAVADRDRIEALEHTISRLVMERSPNTARSAGSNNPFASYRKHATTPTPAGPRGQRLVDTGIAQALVESSPVMAEQLSPKPPVQTPFPTRQSFPVPMNDDHEKTRRVSFNALVDPTLNDQTMPMKTFHEVYSNDAQPKVQVALDERIRSRFASDSSKQKEKYVHTNNERQQSAPISSSGEKPG
ncbi:uncharacterized protein MELLADRAFT_105075 [Melampsora larici-populina 98AG31]|uniref:Uncharacterized protein n=1 Tax=Melampsora larici-populina (strain 98AG31 / pathotype 3-4-7) TaxID=747676 RepID=F4RH60_MELLP|nr:uncharacterized protein MELLADRAFT_105075 [Melampsora larici-populina 98AG31]EGG08388.1 hypothetical protein MELLADRAFT_105075 [Melampsora larici-populina 98AG31]